MYAKLGKTADKDAVDASLVPEILWRYVYGLYGLDADQLGVNFLTFTGDALKLTNPRSAQVLGSIAQTMNVYQVAQSLLSGLFGNTVSATTAAVSCLPAARRWQMLVIVWCGLQLLVELVQLCSVASDGIRLMI